MDALGLKAGIHGIAPPLAVVGNGMLDLPMGQPSKISALGPVPPPRNSPWGFTLRYPFRSLWPGGKNRCEPAIAVDDGVLVEEKEENRSEERESEGENGNWVLKILHLRSLRKEGEIDGKLVEEMGMKLEDDNKNGRLNANDENKGDCCDENEDCDVCTTDGEDDEKIEFNRESFSKLLKKVPLAEARLYAQMSYLGALAYSIPEIKPKNLLRFHGLRFVTSSLEKKEQELKAEEEKALVEEQQKEEKTPEEARVAEGNVMAESGVEMPNRKQINASAAYEIAASAASYLHAHTKSILRFRTSKSMPSENFLEETKYGTDNVNLMNRDVASLMATTDSVTAVVAAKEEVKQAVADDLNSIKSSPCEWFACDDDQSATRFFIIQGSESLASWQANLLFEPVKFEGLDVLVHRGIYEAAKGTYEQMLPEIHAHLKSHGDRAKFRFTGHSLGGSLSVLVNLMLLIRAGAPVSSLLPAITFGAPSIMCGGDRLLRDLRLPRNHVQAITMHRDIVPRAFSCNYPDHVAEFLKAVNGNFRNLPCLNNQVWREKNVIKPAAGKRQCNCRNEVYHRQIGPGMFQQMTEQVCEQCPNVKYEREGYFITVDIEKGMQDGQEVVFYEDGEPKIDGEGGDLKFHIRTAPHDVFTREGNDLRTTVTITLVQALVGFEKTIKHLDDHLVDISSKGITKPKEVRKFKGEGMLLHFSNKKGDLYVTFEVLFPTSLTDDQKTKIKEILG